MAEVAESYDSICCTCTTPFRTPSRPCWRSRCSRRCGGCRSSPRCTAPISRWWAPTVPTSPSPNSPSSNRTASPRSANICARETVDVFGVPNEIRVIKNFVNCDLYHPDEAKTGAARLRAGRRKAADPPFEFPAGEARARLRAHSGRGPQARAGAPADGGRRPGARPAEHLARELKVERHVSFLGKQRPRGAADSAGARAADAERTGVVRPGGAGGHGVRRSARWPRAWAACRS